MIWYCPAAVLAGTTKLAVATPFAPTVAVTVPMPTIVKVTVPTLTVRELDTWADSLIVCAWPLTANTGAAW